MSTRVPTRPAGRRLAALLLTTLVLLLPALAAGAGIDAAAHAGELQRVTMGLHRDAAADARSVPARQFYGMTLPSQPRTSAPAELLPQARFASVLGVLALSCLLYLAVALARGRVTALLSCAALALLAPVGREGFVLRPEVPASVFGSLGIVLLIAFPVFARRRPGANVVTRRATLLVLMVAIGASFGLAAACLPPAGAFLLVPGASLLLVVALLLLRTPRMLRRRRTVLRLPFRGVQARVLPWLLLCFLNLVTVMAVMYVAVQGEPRALAVSRSDAGLLPASALLSWPLLLLALVGTLRLLLGVGLRVGRKRRVTSEVLLLLWVAVMLVVPRLLGEPGADALPSAAPFAVLVGEGAMVALVVVLGLLLSRRR